MAQTPGGAHSDAAQMTGAETVENISEEARERAQEEFAGIAPGPTDPLHFGPDDLTTQLSEDPISEVNPFQESRP